MSAIDDFYNGKKKFYGKHGCYPSRVLMTSDFFSKLNNDLKTTIRRKDDKSLLEDMRFSGCEIDIDNEIKDFKFYHGLSIWDED